MRKITQRNTALLASALVGVVYLGGYFIFVKRESGTIWSVGPARDVVYPSYRMCYPVAKVVFTPIEWLDVNILRPRYWKPVADERREERLQSVFDRTCQ